MLFLQTMVIASTSQSGRRPERSDQRLDDLTEDLHRSFDVALFAASGWPPSGPGQAALETHGCQSRQESDKVQLPSVWSLWFSRHDGTCLAWSPKPRGVFLFKVLTRLPHVRRGRQRLALA